MPTLLRELKKFYKANARAHLPWRRTRDPYKILVSEFMLQQTQVDRVVPFYRNFLKLFPTPKALAKAPLSKVLMAWQGLGYNRRAKYLQEATKVVAKSGWPAELEDLPGVGPYTARAIMAFAYNRPEVFTETNIRTVFFHHHLPKTTIYRSVSDAELLPWVAVALKKSHMEPREFYAALMDYGSYLKRQGVRLNAKSKHYTKQSTFKGSTRELRGAIVRELLQGSKSAKQITKDLSRRAGEVDIALAQLVREGMITQTKGRYSVPQ